jgi:flagellar biosynthesis/type III secretory pathway M-ring protein FliF/YscJ
MKDIERASVLYDVKTKPGTGLSKETVATASVSVKPVGSLRLDEERVRDIRNFVAGAIAELQPENISVSDQNGRTYPAGDSSMIGPQV